MPKTSTDNLPSYRPGASAGGACFDRSADGGYSAVDSVSGVGDGVGSDVVDVGV